jgi:hypothetical protein
MNNKMSALQALMMPNMEFSAMPRGKHQQPFYPEDALARNYGQPHVSDLNQLSDMTQDFGNGVPAQNRNLREILFDMGFLERRY